MLPDARSLSTPTPAATHPPPLKAMDTWALNLKAGGPCPTPRRPLPATWAPISASDIGSPAVGRRRWSWEPTRRPLVAVSASGRRSKNNRGDGDGDGDEAKNKASSSGHSDASAPVGGGSDGMNPSHDEGKCNDLIYISQSDYWRDVRAAFVFQKQDLAVDPNFLTQSGSDGPLHQLPQKWAHAIPMPEAGCVLVATKELDANSTFERTVILLLRLGSRDPYDGPFGVILNRPLYTKIKHVNQSFRDEAMPFGDCSLFFGGPVDMSMFLVRSNDGTPIKGFEEVIPGVCFGFRTDLEKVGVLMKHGAIRTQDLKFFVGHSAWDPDQLLNEIEEGYWVVASCSSQLISDALTTDPSCLWTEILQLMGGQYSELSRKPKQDSS